MNFFKDLREKTLTAAEKKKREEIAKAIERDDPGMDMSKKMAIATAQAKKVAEETVDEAIKLAPKTWHDVDKKLGKQVDKMSQAEKVKKGFAHPDTLKKKKGQGVAEGQMPKTPSDDELHKTLGPTKNRSQGVQALMKGHGMSRTKAKHHISRLMSKLAKEEVELDETPKVDRGLSGKQKVAARAERGDNSGGFNIGNTTGGTWRGKDAHSPYKDSGVAKSGERKGLLKKSAIAKTKDVIKSRLNKEEVEQVDELKTSTIRSYLGKANKSTTKIGQRMKGATKALDRLRGFQVTKLKPGEVGKPMATHKKQKYTGESVDEVSDTTLKNYNKGAMRDTMMGKKDRNAGMQQATKRLAGLNKPLMKGPNEETVAETQYKMVGGKKMRWDDMKKMWTPVKTGFMEQDKKETPPFDGPYRKKSSAVAGKHGEGPSTAKHLAKMGLKQFMNKSK